MGGVIPPSSPPPAPKPDPVGDSELTGLNLCVQGDGGTGKTHSLGTLVDYGADPAHPLDVFVQMLEPGLETLKGYWVDRGKPIPPNLHWSYIRPTTADLDAMIGASSKVNTLNHKALAEMQDPERSKYAKWTDIQRNLNGFVDARDGKNYGRVYDWGLDRVLAMDGLTGFCRAAMSLVIGGKPVRSQSDWGIAQGEVEKMLLYLTDSCRCHFVLLAHIERETDQVLGGSKIMVSALGQKLAPKLPPMFSDVIMSVREGASWTWDTSNPQAVLKARNLPIAANQKQDFAPIFNKWKKRNEAQ
jgi:hypothetical protein